MDDELERFIDEGGDRRLIPGIYNYCHRRCERCPFTDRCLTFRHMRDHLRRESPVGGVGNDDDNGARTAHLLKGWYEQGRIELGPGDDRASAARSLASI